MLSFSILNLLLIKGSPKPQLVAIWKIPYSRPEVHEGAAKFATASGFIRILGKFFYRKLSLPLDPLNLKNQLMKWRKFNGETINLPIKEEVRRAIIREKEKGYKLKVCIGTDSQVKGAETEFATVIVFLREHRGGFMFIHNDKTLHKFQIKERMLVEVSRSIEIAYELCDLFTEYDVDMEVHADINTN